MNVLKGKFAVPILVSLLVVALGIAWHNTRSKSAVAANASRMFWIDDETGVESAGPGTSECPPVSGQDGRPTLVQVVKYTFDGKNFQNLYFVKYSDDAKAELQALASEEPTVRFTRTPTIMDNGKLVRSPEPGSPWVQAFSAEGYAVCKTPRGPDGALAQIISGR